MAKLTHRLSHGLRQHTKELVPKDLAYGELQLPRGPDSFNFQNVDSPAHARKRTLTIEAISVKIT